MTRNQGLKPAASQSKKDYILNKSQPLVELIYYCTRCKSDLSHRVLESHQGVPKQVLCLTCQTSRAFRPKPLAVQRTALRKAAAEQEALESQWRKKILESRRAPKAYSMEGSYKVDDIVSHDSFGVGITTRLIGPDKMQIFFDNGLKLMKCGPTER